MKMSTTTPTIMVSSPVVGVEVKLVSRMVVREEVAEGAMVVVVTTANPGGEESGDGGSPSIILTDNCSKKITNDVTVHYTYLY